MGFYDNFEEIIDLSTVEILYMPDIIGMKYGSRRFFSSIERGHNGVQFSGMTQTKG